MLNAGINSLLEDQAHELELTASSSHRLMLAVLEEALVTFQRGLRSSVPQQRQRFREVDRWVASTDEHLPFSFENICSSLKIDPGYVRKGLKRLKTDAQAGKEIRKPRRLRREHIYDRRGWRGRIR